MEKKQAGPEGARLFCGYVPQPASAVSYFTYYTYHIYILMALLAFFAFMILVFAHVSLRNRVDELERKVRSLRYQASVQAETKYEETAPYQPAEATTNVPPPFGAPETPVAPVYSEPAPLPPPPSYTPLYSEAPTEDFFLVTWFREQTLIKIGSIIFFLGAVWFVSLAIQENWISPFMRIVLGLLLAGAIYVVGHWRRAAEVTQYQVLTTLGTGVFLGTAIASQFAFPVPILPPFVALGLMVVSIAYTLHVALQTKTEWLGVVASVAGLLAPVLVKFDEPLSALLLSYVFLLSIGFVAVVFFTAWRGVSLTLVFGSAFYLALVYSNSALNENVLWFFVVLFSLLFCASTAVSILRTNQPALSDVLILVTISLQFVLYANEIALFPALALFVAAAVTGFVGYALRIRGVAADGVSLFVAISLICSLIGTAKLFDGFVLTIAYSVEVLALYFLSIRLATVPRSIVIAALLFALPLFSGVANLMDPSWNSGVFHAEALGVLSVIITLGFAVVWSLRSPALQSIDWLRQTAGGLLIAWYTFVVAASVVVGDSQQSFDEGSMTTILLTILAALVIVYLLRAVPRDSWQGIALFTLLAPTFSALALLADSAWNSGVMHQPFLGASFYFVSLLSIMMLYWVNEPADERSNGLSKEYAYLLVWVAIGFGFMFLSTIWDTLLSGDAERVVTAVSYTVLIYLIANGLMLLRVSVGKLLPILFVLILPGVLLLESLEVGGWSAGLMDINAVGLYVTTTILFLLATTLLEYRQYVADTEREPLQVSASALYVIAGLLVFALVWIMNQTVFTEGAIAVTIALFIYTVAGLFSYSRGRMTGSVVWKRVGVLLLSAVILRLALVDVWDMELVWRIFTFLGIGLLFIVTALLERPKENIIVSEE